MKEDYEILTQLRAAYESGASKDFEALIKKHRLNKSSVIRRAKIEQWGKQQIAPPEEGCIPPIESVPHEERGKIYQEQMGKAMLKIIPHIEQTPFEEIINNARNIEKIDLIARRNFGLDRAQNDGPTININLLSEGLTKYAQATIIDNDEHEVLPSINSTE